MDKRSKIYVAGHRGLVGSAIVRALKKAGYENLVLRTHAELDLLDRDTVATFFDKEKPGYVFMAAAKVGGIVANKTYPAEFINSNLGIQVNLIDESHRHKVKKLMFLGSACIYPKVVPQPIKEEYFLTGPLEPTNKAYAISKIAGIIECQSYHEQYGDNFISVMPTNLYGPGDNFDLENSHVLPAMLRKFHEAKRSGASSVTLWGTGSPKREFLHADDMASACVFLMERYDNPAEFLNIGTGEDISIKELAEKIKMVVGYTGRIVWDTSKPDGTPLRRLDVSKLHALGWKHTINLDKGIKTTYEWYKASLKR